MDFNNQDPLLLLQQGINQCNTNLIDQALSYIIMQRQQVKVNLLKPCLLHASSGNYFQVQDLYFCPQMHAFCKGCIQNCHLQNFQQYGLNFEYYCPACRTGLLYQQQYKEGFLSTIFGEFISLMNQYGNIGINNNIIPDNISNSNELLVQLNQYSKDYSSVARLFYSDTMQPNKYQIDMIYQVNNKDLQSKFNKMQQKLLQYSNKILEL